MKAVSFALMLFLAGAVLLGCGSDPADLDLKEELDVCVTPECDDADEMREIETGDTILLQCIWYCTEFEGKRNRDVDRVYQSFEDGDCFVWVYDRGVESQNCR
jgi:hypothetical protein